MHHSKEAPLQALSEEKVRDIFANAFSQRDFSRTKILCIIPDHTRSGPVDLMFRMLYRFLSRSARLDFMIALGTHPPMKMDAIYSRVGISAREHRELYPKARFFNHAWRDRRRLATIGSLSGSEVAALSGGLLDEKVDVTIARRALRYDMLMIAGPTFPHEVVGFSGGNKYLFPGIAGGEIIHLFHWLGALLTSPAVIGVKDTPVRRIIDRSARFLPMERMCAGMVVRENALLGLFIGTPEEAYEAAADLSEKVHIVYKERPYDRVLSCAPPMYEDLWTGGKCMYKIEPVVADGGELIIYAPHISEVSVTHGREIEKIGYHVRDYFLRQKENFRNVPGCVKAHSTHVKGTGSYENGVEKPRIRVTLATRIPEALCRRLTLGYRDPDAIHPEEWDGREDEGILRVSRAGEMLYRLKKEGP